MKKQYDENLHIIMSQRHTGNWDVLSPKGHVMTSNVHIPKPYTPDSYAKNYISSFTNWSYVVKYYKQGGSK